MENNKFVKKLTKGLIIAMCCILPMGAISIPSLALESPPIVENWPYTYFVFYNRTYEDTDDGGMLTFLGSDDTYRYQFFNANLLCTHSYKPITIDDGGTKLGNNWGYFIIDITANIGDVIQLNNGEFENDTFLAVFEIVDNEITIGSPTQAYYRPYLTLRHIGNSQNNEQITVRVKIYVQVASDPYLDPLYQLGYDEGFNAGTSMGFDDGYTTGYLDATESISSDENQNGFIQTIFRPITALHSAVIYDLNGNSVGGEITIGSIFIATLALAGLTAFLKHFAGG